MSDHIVIKEKQGIWRKAVVSSYVGTYDFLPSGYRIRTLDYQYFFLGDVVDHISYIIRLSALIRRLFVRLLARWDGQRWV